MKCKDCSEYDVCHKQSDLRLKRKTCPKAKEAKTITNADRIRAMTDEELAAFLADDDRVCPPVKQNCSRFVHDCVGCHLEWLRMPAKEA